MIEFEPGQVWTYTTRPNEAASRLVVCRVESDRGTQTVIHIRLEGLAIKSPGAPQGVTKVIQHVPFDANSLRDSVLALESTRESLPDFEQAYQVWKDACDKGEAGVFTISVAECVNVIAQLMGG